MLDEFLQILVHAEDCPFNADLIDRVDGHDDDDEGRECRADEEIDLQLRLHLIEKTVYLWLCLRRYGVYDL